MLDAIAPMSSTKVCSGRLYQVPPSHSSNNMCDILAQYHKRCQLVLTLPVAVLPRKIESLLSDSESTTKEAAEQCSCPLCIQVLFDGGRDPRDVCSVCHRRCCEVCTLRLENSIICRSQTCLTIDKFNKRQLSLESLAVECERISRDLLRQWVALQFKGEMQLGPLRALTLFDAKNAALRSIAAKAQLHTAEAADALCSLE
jgi:hypothetical protein